MLVCQSTGTVPGLHETLKIQPRQAKSLPTTSVTFTREINKSFLESSRSASSMEDVPVGVEEVFTVCLLPSNNNLSLGAPHACLTFRILILSIVYCYTTNTASSSLRLPDTDTRSLSAREPEPKPILVQASVIRTGSCSDVVFYSVQKCVCSVCVYRQRDGVATGTGAWLPGAVLLQLQRSHQHPDLPPSPALQHWLGPHAHRQGLL